MIIDQIYNNLNVKLKSSLVELSLNETYNVFTKLEKLDLDLLTRLIPHKKGMGNNSNVFA